MSIEQAAYGAHLIAASNMIRAIKAVSTERGRDPREFALFAFGGNGPLFAGRHGGALGITRVIVPPSAGLFSSFGLLYADVEHHYARTFRRLLRGADLGEIDAAWTGLARQASEQLAAEGFTGEHARLNLIRSFYKYHTHSLGWSDIAYNFLVDSFGTIWEGRYGGIDLPVRGAHTLGFNASSTGFCVIGNFESVLPSQPTLDSLAKLAAWKLSMYARDPLGWTQVTSEGSDKFPKGNVVTLPVIDGHRDTNDTACPGGNLYAQLAAVRAATAGVISAATLKLKTPYAVKGRTVMGHTLTVGNGKFKPTTAAVTYQWLRAGVPITGATAATYVLTAEDVAQLMGVVVTGSLPNVTPISQAIAVETPVRSIPECTTRTQRKKGGKVIVHFELTAPGVAEPDGTVLIKVGSRERTVNVRKGKAVARFVGVEPGRYRVRCQYAGGTLVEPGRARDWVRVPGKGPFAKSSES